MIKEMTMYGCECDNCKTLFEDYSGFVAWNEKEGSVENALDSDWIEHESKHYCPKCYVINDEDEVIINPLVWFIENSDTKWYFEKIESYPEHTGRGARMISVPSREWTSDPERAMRFKSEKEAEDFIKDNSMWDCFDEPTIKITEHEFVH